MELKLVLQDVDYLFLNVLLVPLWNWNFRAIPAQQKAASVLLVPLWNWNLSKNILPKIGRKFYSYLYGIETQ